MKAVDAADLSAALKKPASSKKADKPAKTRMVRRTLNLSEADDQLINQTAAALSKASGKPVGASEAVRHLLELARKGKS